jgi:hypothetical protein
MPFICGRIKFEKMRESELQFKRCIDDAYHIRYDISPVIFSFEPSVNADLHDVALFLVKGVCCVYQCEQKGTHSPETRKERRN